MVYLFDNLIIPMMITDKTGIIKYKNSAAKRCIPSPRCGGNITKRINKRIDFPIHYEDQVRIMYINNNKSVFNRCFSVENEDENMLIFSPELILSEPEDICEADPDKLHRFAKALSTTVTSEQHTDSELISQRFCRMEQYMLEALKYQNYCTDNKCYKLSDILSYIRSTSLRLSRIFNFRLNIFDNAYNPDTAHKISFVPFVLTYSYLLLLTLRISARSECNITALPNAENLLIRFETSAALPSEYINSVLSAEEMAELFPNDRFNIMLLHRKSSMCNYDINFCCHDKNSVCLELSVPLDYENSITLFQPPLPSILTREFHRSCKRTDGLLESILIGWKKTE